ncbi:winged helix-turn-helix domain-containing protein [Pseudoalteromonas sp. MMG007]|uniref:winged helix-turn-helix domain-containing protein n=1 Tax=Pseudoalteromonas sp. MMG007 TaxID=2822684 RepID=UPI001B3651FC|nr:winged helix-turn-helix domain-containing protein [Pseudoalteromonas sp. MMG007]MBQ4859849.1 winged helix-turn-helix domain-containing protein [Pseudoalteromonas sp. MMG007]
MKPSNFSESIVEVKFGAWCLNPKQQTINDGVIERELEPLLFKILCYLILNKESIITRQDLIDDVWCQHYVDDNAINRAVSELRKILKSPNQAALVIKTHYRKGYSFLPNVEFVESGYQSVTSNLVYEHVAKKSAVLGKKKYLPWIFALIVVLLVSAITGVYKLTAKSNGVQVTNKSYQEEVLSMKEGMHTFLSLSPNEKSLVFTLIKYETSEFILINKELATGTEKLLIKPGYEIYPVGWSHNNNEIIYWQSNGQDCQVFIVDSNFAGESRYLFDCSHLPFSGESINNTNLVYSKFGYRNRDELAVLMNRDLLTGEEYQISSPNLNSYGDKFLAHIEGKNKVVFERHQFGFSELYITGIEGGAQTHLYTTKNRIWTLKYNQELDSLLWYDNVDNILFQYSLSEQKLLSKTSMQGVSTYSMTLPISPYKILAFQYPYDADINKIDLNNFNLSDTTISTPSISQILPQLTNNGDIFFLSGKNNIGADRTYKLQALDEATNTINTKSSIAFNLLLRVSRDGEEALRVTTKAIEIHDTELINLKDSIQVNGTFVNTEFLINKNIGFIVRGSHSSSNSSYVYDRTTKKSVILPISNAVWFDQLSTTQYIFLSAQNKLQIFDSWKNKVITELDLNPVKYRHSLSLDGNKLFHSDGINVFLYDFSLGFNTAPQVIYKGENSRVIRSINYNEAVNSLFVGLISSHNNKIFEVTQVKN